MIAEELRDDFIKVCSICLDNDMLVDEFCRLKKIKRPDKISSIEKQIDNACGYDAGMDFMKQFTDFVMEFIYIPVLVQQMNDFKGGYKMLYSIGDVLRCKYPVNAQCLEMTNPNFDVKIGERYIITDKDYFPEDNHCHWYELTNEVDRKIVLNAWNDEGHMILDEKFEILKD